MADEPEQDFLTVLYSCEGCGVVDVEVKVRLRRSDEDVIAWMKKVVEPALGAHHHFYQSPDCKAMYLTEVKIPMPPGTEFIGGPVQH